MKIILFAISLVLLVVISGCGTPASFQRVDNYIKSGQCQNARIAAESATDMEASMKAMVLAAVYLDCYKNRPEAVKWLTYSARFGLDIAQNQLMKMGERVPTPDLKNQSGSNAFVDALRQHNDENAARIKAANEKRSVNCTSTKSGSTVDTYCY